MVVSKPNVYPLDMNATNDPGEIPEHENTRLCEYKLCDFWVSTAHNCCSGKSGYEGELSVDAMNECLHKGARCLDFEIMSFRRVPHVVIADSLTHNYKISANTIFFDDVCSEIRANAFVNGNTDPLFLHFRVMSSNINCFNEMANVIEERFKGLLLDDYGKNQTVHYGYECSKNKPIEDSVNTTQLGDCECNEAEYLNDNFGNIKMKCLQSKIVIMVYSKDNFHRSTNLYKYTNISSNSPNMTIRRDSSTTNVPGKVEQANEHAVTYNQVAAETLDIASEKNKTSITYLAPYFSRYHYNLPGLIYLNHGCQFVGINYHNEDEQLKKYIAFFEKRRSSIILKPGGNLRDKLIYEKPIQKQDPNLDTTPEVLEISPIDGETVEITI
jgi:hypothetical protein